MSNIHLVFIPACGVGHLFSAVEFAKHLINHDDRISITMFIMNFPSNTNQTLPFSSSERLKFVRLSLEPSTEELLVFKPPGIMYEELCEIVKPKIRDYISSEVYHVSAFVVDMFCTPYIDIANELKVPAYVYFTSSTAFLSLIFHLQILEDEYNQNVYELKDSDAELSVLGFSNIVPARVLPGVLVDKDLGFPNFFDIPRRLRETKGILINTFMELESNMIKLLSNEIKVPQIYPVGPLLASIHKISKPEDETQKTCESVDIMSWLDDQPLSSVVLLCFGSMGSFEKEQIVEIANALENSGHRFLWGLRRPPPQGKRELPSEYENLDDVLPEGFLDRTSKMGKIVGWIPQVKVLSHPSVGGFVSHCGWNSTLESIWCGVPIAAWPLYAEQKINAFELIKELGLAAEIKMDYNKGFLVTSDMIEKGIRDLIDDQDCSAIRKKVKEMSEKSQVALNSGGSSHNALSQFIADLVSNSNGQEE